jgi:hypothetical protein
MLITHHFLFIAEVLTPLELDHHSGAALRGSLFNGVWYRFCNNKAATTCATCPLHNLCPVSALVAPLREENERGRDIPRPYIILPPLDARYYAPGERLVFGITLFGNIVKLFPYLIMALQSIEANGLGKKLEANKGKRGTFKILSIESYNPVITQRQVIYQTGKPVIDAPALTVTHNDILTRASSLSSRRLTLHFLTPTRLLHQEKLVHQPTFFPLIARLLERLTALEKAYSDEAAPTFTQQWQHLPELAASIQCIENATTWEDVQSYSHRTKRSTPIGGLQGKATYKGNLEPFREILAWGELIHVGKNTVKGNGWYRIED